MERPFPQLSKVVAIGTDLLDSRRIEQSLARFGQRFVERILTADERLIYQKRQQSVNFLAKQFAAKEALAKALGTGIAKGVGFQELEILRNEQGTPYVNLYAGAALKLAELGADRALVSLSDEGTLVLAFALLQ